MENPDFPIKNLAFIRAAGRHHPQFVWVEADRLHNAAVTLFLM